MSPRKKHLPKRSRSGQGDARPSNHIFEFRGGRVVQHNNLHHKQLCPLVVYRFGAVQAHHPTSYGVAPEIIVHFVLAHTRESSLLAPA